MTEKNVESDVKQNSSHKHTSIQKICHKFARIPFDTVPHKSHNAINIVFFFFLFFFFHSFLVFMCFPVFWLLSGTSLLPVFIYWLKVLIDQSGWNQFFRKLEILRKLKWTNLKQVIIHLSKLLKFIFRKGHYITFLASGWKAPY